MSGKNTSFFSFIVYSTVLIKYEKINNAGNNHVENAIFLKLRSGSLLVYFKLTLNAVSQLSFGHIESGQNVDR